MSLINFKKCLTAATMSMFIIGTILAVIFVIFNAMFFIAYKEGQCTITSVDMGQISYVDHREYYGFVDLVYNGIVTNLTRRMVLFRNIKDKTLADNNMIIIKQTYNVGDNISCYYQTKPDLWLSIYIKSESNIQYYAVIVPYVLSATAFIILVCYTLLSAIHQKYLNFKNRTSVKNTRKINSMVKNNRMRVAS